MNTLSGDLAVFITLYQGDPILHLGASGPCNLVYCTTSQGNIDCIMFLSETDWGAPTLMYLMTVPITEQDFLGACQQLEPPYTPDPIKSVGINHTTGEIIADLDTINRVIGGLQTGVTVFTINSQNKVTHVAFLSPEQQGAIKLYFTASPLEDISVWRSYNMSSTQVESITV